MLWKVVAGVLAVVLVGVAIRTTFATSESQRIEGQVVLVDPSGTPLVTCSNPAVDPPSAGASVVLRDEQDRIVGLAHLAGPAVEAGTCSVSFVFPKVPVRRFYTVAVGNRQPVAFSQSEVERGHGHIQIAG